MNGQTCANCGWSDNTLVDEVWGLPAPDEPAPPARATVPPPPPTVIAVAPQGPSTMSSSQPIPSGGYAAPVPPVPPSPSGGAAYQPQPPQPPQPPSKSRAGFIVAAVVAVAVLAIGAIVVFGGGDDESATADTRTERTDDTRETTPDTDETTPDTTENTTENTNPTPESDPVNTATPDPGRDYPDGVRTNFLDACEENSPAATCLCILEGLETVYSLDEFAALEQEFTETGVFSDTFTSVVAGCQ